MKRFLSLVLTLILALSLTVSAVASENEELWQEYGFDSRKECIQLYFDGDEAAYQREEDLRLERQQWEAGMAGEIAAFDADAYWESGECWQSVLYLSKEEFMEEWLLESEAAFRECMLEDWLDEQWEAYEQSQLVAWTRAELGGVPGQIGVMLDGAYIPFPDAAPEYRNGRTMVPCRQVLEALGGTVRYENGTVVCVLDGTTLRFRDGSDTVMKTCADGTESAIGLDVPCYYKNGRTYIPVRFFAEALGCDVLWDKAFQTAVLLRRDAVIAGLDEQFTVVNRMLTAIERDASKNYKTVVKLNADVKVLDSINGDKCYHTDAGMELLQSGAVVNLTARADLSALLDVEELAPDMAPPERLALRAALKNMKIKVIYDGEGGMLYMSMPAMSLLTDGEYPDGSWVSAPVETLAELETSGGVTVGGLLYASVCQEAETFNDGSYYDGMTTPALLVRDMTELADEAAAYVGDGCFEESGGCSVLRYDQEAYNAALDAEYGEGAGEYYSEFEQLETELKIARSGAATFRVLVQNKDEGYGEVVLVDASGSVTATQVDMKLLLKIKNELDMTLRYTADTNPTREEPVTAPGPGETVIDPYGELGSGEEPASGETLLNLYDGVG